MIGLALASAIAGLVLMPSVPDTPRDIPLPVSTSAEEAPLHLTIVGTSLTAFYEWPDQVAAGLEICLGREIALRVIARPGALSSWGLQQLDQIAQSRPDIVVIEMAINDADISDGLWLRDSRRIHQDLIAGLEEITPAPQIVLMTMSPAQGPRGLLRFRLSRYYTMVVDLAVEQDLGLLDLYPRWMVLSRADRGLQADGLHPDPEVANPLISQALTAYLGRNLDRTCDP